jgi:ABC-type transport system involved in multi-copper enzyme maturation permease subunit
MTLLPVLLREMRTAARNANTYRIRFLAALVAVLFTGFSIWLVTFFDESPIPPRELFQVLAIIDFLFVLAIGFSLTADAISEEKRESTLPLLFLAGLKPWDIVLGKLAGAAARGVMAPLATIPVLALPILLGGADAKEFLRVSAVLGLTLLFSMSAGLMFSAMVQRGWTAYGLSAGLVLLFCVGLPFGSIMAREFRLTDFNPDLISIPSPAYALHLALNPGPASHFGIAISVLAGLSLIMQAAGIAVLPSAWKDRPARSSVLVRWRSWIAYGSSDFRRAFRRRLLEKNPVYWLNSRPRTPALGLLLAIASIIVANWIFQSHVAVPNHTQAQAILPFMLWVLTAGSVHALVLLRIPIAAAERFSEDAKSGALELLLTSPLGVSRILYGHWLALRRNLAGPAALALLVHCVPVALFVAIQPAFFGRNYTLLELVNLVFERLAGARDTPYWENGLMILAMLAVIPSVVVTWFSLACLGTWLSLRVRRAMAVPILALALSALPPALMLATVASIKEYNRWNLGNDYDEIFYMSLAWFLHAGTQLFWIAFCGVSSIARFRKAAADRYSSGRRRWWQMRIL